MSRVGLISPVARLFKRYSLLLVALVVLVAPFAPQVLAQGSLSYGNSVTGSLSADSPLAIYTFNGNAGDHVTAFVVGITPELSPSLSLFDMTQTQLAVGSGVGLSVIDESVASITYRLPKSGIYTLWISSASGVLGDYLLHLGAQPSEASLELSLGAATGMNLPPGAKPMRYSFTANPMASQTLLLTTDTPNFAFVAQVYDGNGQLVALLDGKAMQGVSLLLGPDTGLYEVVLAAKDPASQGAIRMLLAAGEGNEIAPPVTTPTPTPAVVVPPTAEGCQVTGVSGGNVNVRSGPDVVFGRIGSLFGGTTLQVVGRNPEGNWYVVDMSGQRGWISGAVTRLVGDCRSLDVYASPPTPTPMPATATPEPPPGAVINFTVDGTGSKTVLPGGCAMVAWNTANIKEVYYKGIGVPGIGTSEECPAATTTYTLRVVLQDDTETLRHVSIIVQPLIPMLTIPPLLLTPMIIVTIPGP